LEVIIVEVAKVTSKGQITIPITIRRRLEINEGDKVLFIYKPEGVLMVNPNTYQSTAADIAETAKPEAVAKPVSPTKEKPAGKASQKPITQPADTEVDDEDTYIEVDVIIEESEEDIKPLPKASPMNEAPSGKQVGGLDLSTLLDDIRSIGSKI
jgi:AbrB family looped-hinge helix DNA binding protein